MADTTTGRFTDQQLSHIWSNRKDVWDKLTPVERSRMEQLGLEEARSPQVPGAFKPLVSPVRASEARPAEDRIPPPSLGDLFKIGEVAARAVTRAPEGLPQVVGETLGETARETLGFAAILPGELTKSFLEGVRSVEGHELAVPFEMFNRAGGFLSKSLVPGTEEFKRVGAHLLSSGYYAQKTSRAIFGFGSPENIAAGTAITQGIAGFTRDRVEYAKKWFDDPIKATKEDPWESAFFLADLVAAGTIVKAGGKPVIRWMGKQVQTATTRRVSEMIGKTITENAVKIHGSMSKLGVRMTAQESWAAAYMRGLYGVKGDLMTPADYGFWKLPLQEFKQKMAGLTKDPNELGAYWKRSTKSAVNHGQLKPDAANELAGWKKTTTMGKDGKPVIQWIDPETGKVGKPLFSEKDWMDPAVRADETWFDPRAPKTPEEGPKPGLPILRVSKEGEGVAPDLIPRPHGKLRDWMIEGGMKEGQVAFDAWMQGNNSYQYMVRVIGDRVNELFRGVRGTDRDRIMGVLRGVNMKDGNVTFGGVHRSGVLNRGLGKKAQEFDELFPPGTVLDDGRVVGTWHESDPTKVMTYRYIDPKKARSAYEALPEKHQNIIRVLRAETEEPVILGNGERAPALSLKVFRDQFGLNPNMEKEAEYASSLMKMAYGPDAFPGKRNWQFNFVPETALKGDSFFQRSRSAMSLHGKKPDTRKLKAGRVAEIVRESGDEVADLRMGLKKNMAEMYAEPVHDEMVSKILATVAQPIGRGESVESVESQGFYVFSKTGLFKDSERMRRFWKKHENYFASRGIDVHSNSDAVKAAMASGGKGYKIPQPIADDLKALFGKEVKSTDPLLRESNSAIGTAVGEMLAIPMITWLSKPSTAWRNMLSQGATFAPKVIRDAYIGMMDLVPLYRFDEIPFQSLWSDFVALKTFGPMHRGTMAPELFGSTFVQHLENAPLSNTLGQILRLTGFNFWDVASKRLVWESTVDAQLKNLWHQMRRAGKTKGMTKAEFLAAKRADLPADIAHAAYREMDVWGAYDYSNVPRWLERIKASNVWRGTFPYMTYPVKLLTTYSELYSPRNVIDLFVPNAKRAALGKWMETPSTWPGPFRGAIKEKTIQRARMTAKHLQDPVTWQQRKLALANLLTASSISTFLLNRIDNDGNPSDEIFDDQTREAVKMAEKIAGRKVKDTDLPYQVQRFGRFRTPDALNSLIFKQDEQSPGMISEADFDELKGLRDDKALWVRYYDIPFWGEHAAAKAIWKGEMTPVQFLMDRITLGPLFTNVAAIAGLATKYTEHLPVASRVGRAMTGWVPLQNELKLIRQLSDPMKREAGRETAGPVQNFLMGVAENMPIASTFLPPRLKRRTLSIPQYNRWESLASYGLLNARAQSDEERQALIALTALENLGDVRDQLNRDQITELILQVRRGDGTTAAGEAKRKAGLEKEAILFDLGKATAAILMKRAFTDGGLPAVAKVAEKAFYDYARSGAPDPRAVLLSIREQFRYYMRIEQAGLRGIAFGELPVRQRTDFIRFLMAEDDVEPFLRTPEERENLESHGTPMFPGQEFGPVEQP